MCLYWLVLGVILLIEEASDLNTNKINFVHSEKIVEISEFITPGNILFTIIYLNPIKVQGYLSEYDVNKVQIGTKTIIENSNGVKKDGKITFISPSAETSTRTFEITIVMAESFAKPLLSGAPGEDGTRRCSA